MFGLAWKPTYVQLGYIEGSNGDTTNFFLCIEVILKPPIEKKKKRNSNIKNILSFIDLYLNKFLNKFI